MIRYQSDFAKYLGPELNNLALLDGHYLGQVAETGFAARDFPFCGFRC